MGMWHTVCLGWSWTKWATKWSLLVMHDLALKLTHRIAEIVLVSIYLVLVFKLGFIFVKICQFGANMDL